MSGAWPRYAGRPLSFVAQLDLAEMWAAGGPDWLPKQGLLLFFYDLEHGGWGFDPNDAGSFVVRYETDGAGLAAAPPDLPDDARFPAYPLVAAAGVSYPDEQRLNLDLRGLSKAEELSLEAALEALTPAEPAHQVGGYPAPIQNDGMELECQLASHGLHVGRPEGYKAKQVESLKPGAADWRLLLQVDTDHEAGMMWGDTGRLYFWIREQDARAGDFSKAWMILQCY